MRNAIHVALLLGLATGAIASADTPPLPATATTTPPASAPAYQLDTWREDYSYLKDPANRTDFWDFLKYIPLGASGDNYLTLGAQLRERYEHYSDDLFLAPHLKSDSSGYNLQRLLPYADLHLGPDIRFFVQARLSFEEGRPEGARPNDVDQGDFEQAFLDLRAPIGDQSSITARFGRQNLNLGALRLVGTADFNNDRRTFDGFRGIVAVPGNTLDLFVVRPVSVEFYDLNSDDDRTTFAGAYDTLSLPTLLPGAKTKLESYLFYLDRDNTTYRAVTGAGDDQRFTLGSRITASPGNFDFDVEGDYQFGRFNGERISAFSVATLAGYSLKQVVLAPHPFVGFDIASGDRDANNGSLGTFNQLFPTGHAYFGYIDAIGRQNIIDLHPGIDLTFLKDVRYAKSLTLRTEFHEFWRESENDAVYNAAGAVFRAGTSSATYIGSELDFLVNWQVDRHLSAYMGYSHFYDGAFLRDTGPAHGIDFFYAAVTYTF